MSDVHLGSIPSLLKVLSGATRHGLHSSSSTRKGFLAEVDLGIASLSPELVEQLLDEFSSHDVSALVTALATGRPAAGILDLEPEALLKLRATVLLGLADARLMHDYERGRALNRTFMSSRLITDSSGRSRYQPALRDGDSLPSRAEREQVIRLISLEIQKRISRTLIQPHESNETQSQQVAGGVEEESDASATGDDYIICDYVDRAHYPSSEGECVVLVRRRRIKALRDGVFQFRQHYSLFTNTGATPRPQILAAGDLLITNVRTVAIGNRRGFEYDLIIVFPALNKDEARTLEWVTTWAPASDDIGGKNVGSVILVPTVSVQHAEFSVSFASDNIPARVWNVDNVRPAEARRRMHQPSEGGRVAFAEHEADAPRQGRATGIVWEW